LVRRKDTETQIKFLQRLGFNLFTNKERYDAVICNTNLIPEPTDNASVEGIRVFSPVAHAVTEFMLSRALGKNDQTQSTRNLQEEYGSMIQRINERPWSF
jgi:cytidylate kinase